MNERDWRLTHQENYLNGVMLIRRQWRPSQPGWDHDHCAFCWAEFGPSENVIHEGWTTTDEGHWICDGCFADFREQFQWRVL
jgi:hypothetical protein